MSTVKTLKNQVRGAIAMNRSGAIEVGFAPETGGTQSVSWGRMEEFVSECLVGFGLRCERFHNSADIRWDIDKGVIHPLTEKAWERLEQLHQQFGEWHSKPSGHWYFHVNNQDAAHSLVNFAGVLDVQHDSEYIKREQARSAREAREAGYGTSRMGGWVE